MMIKLKNGLCSIPYYRKDQYDRLRDVSVDKETFSKSYDDSVKTTKVKHLEMESKGFRVVKIDVDVEELINWCDSLCVPINPEFRTRFALEKLKEMISKNLIG